MSKLFTGSIDADKIDKSKIFTTDKGKRYINVSIWINDEPDQYGNIMAIQQTTKKDEGKIYLGNAKEYVKSSETKPAQSTPESNDLPW